jgi:hypothetical protein
VAITGEPYSYAGNDPANASDLLGLSTYQCENGFGNYTYNGCQGVWVYSKLVGYIQANASTAWSALENGNAKPFMKMSFHILGVLYEDVYQPGAVGHNNYNRWASTSYNCSAEDLIQWFTTQGGPLSKLGYMPGVNTGLILSHFVGAADWLASPANNLNGQSGSIEGTLAYWFYKVGWTPGNAVGSVINIATNAIATAACSAFTAEDMELGEQACEATMQASGF